MTVRGGGPAWTPATVFVAWAVVLNLPGVLLLASPVLETAFGAFTLFFLPLYALWGLPAAALRSAAPHWFAATEFGIYPAALPGWIALFAFWSGIALTIAAWRPRRHHGSARWRQGREE